MAKRKSDKYLNNNENLPIKVDVEWTPALLEEYKKCKNDVLYFAENYFFIIEMDAEPPRHRIQLYDPQKEAILKIVNNRRTVVCASRQVGKTTLLTVICLWYALFKTDYTIAILANKEDQAKEILERIKLAYEEIPNWLKSGVWDFTKEQVKLTNGSRILVSTTSADAIRGKSINMLFIDEFAHVRKEVADPFFKSIIPTLSSSKKSKLILVSCVTGDTMLFTDQGPKQIIDLIPDQNNTGAYEVPEYVVQGKNTLNKGTIVVNNGLAPVNEFVTSNSILKCSTNHKLFAYKNGKYDWWESGQLEVGDRIAIRYGMNQWGSNDDVSDFIPLDVDPNDTFKTSTLTPSICYILGLYIARARWYTVNPEHSSSENTLNFLRYIGFDPSEITVDNGRLSRTLTYSIPTRLLSMSKPNILAMLKGIYAISGYIPLDTNDSIQLRTASYKLIEQVRLLLLNFGVLTTLTKDFTLNDTIYTLQSENLYTTIFSHRYDIDRAVDVGEDNIKWDTITHKIALGDLPVYDVSLNNTSEPDPWDWSHSVIYNGVVGHQTPNGRGNKFYEIYSQAESGKDTDGWVSCKIHWSQIPGRDDNWKLEQLRTINYDMNMWNQEFELQFLESGSGSINAGLIERMKQQCIPPKYVFNDGEYEIWEMPEEGHIYVFGIDTAEGVGKDYSVCQILDITDLADIRQVAKYYTNTILPNIFAERIANIVPAWGRPYICVESNKEGGIVLDNLMNVHGIDNIVTYNMDNDKRGYYQKPGIFCHTNSKTMGITNLRYWVENLEALTVYDIKTVREFETFVRKDGNTRKWGAMEGHTDDHYMALLWALILLDKRLAEKYLDVIEYDDAGNPARIRDPNYDLAIQSFREGNPKVANNGNRYVDPLPMYVDRLESKYGLYNTPADDTSIMLANGWRLV